MYTPEQLEKLDTALTKLNSIREENEKKGYKKDFSWDSPQMVEYIKMISKKVMEEDIKKSIL